MKKRRTNGLSAIGKKSKTWMLAVTMLVPVLITFCAVPARNNAEAADLPDQTYMPCL